MGLAAGVFVVGGGGSCTGRNAQCVLAAFALSWVAPDLSAGYCAPALTHSVSAATASAGRGFLGGIGRSPSRRTARTIGLFVGSPGTTTGPPSDPGAIPSAVSSRRPAICFLAPWQE